MCHSFFKKKIDTNSQTIAPQGFSTASFLSTQDIQTPCILTNTGCFLCFYNSFKGRQLPLSQQLPHIFHSPFAVRLHRLGGLEVDKLPHIVQQSAGRSGIPHRTLRYVDILVDAVQRMETLFQLTMQRVVCRLYLIDPAPVRVHCNLGRLGIFPAQHAQPVQL